MYNPSNQLIWRVGMSIQCNVGSRVRIPHESLVSDCRETQRVYKDLVSNADYAKYWTEANAGLRNTIQIIPLTKDECSTQGIKGARIVFGTKNTQNGPEITKVTIKYDQSYSTDWIKYLIVFETINAANKKDHLDLKTKYSKNELSKIEYLQKRERLEHKVAKVAFPIICVIAPDLIEEISTEKINNYDVYASSEEGRDHIARAAELLSSIKKD